MADRDLNINVTATDRGASAELDEMAARAAELERDRRVEVTADTAQAETAAESAGRKLDQLTGKDRRIVLQYQADALEREIGRTERSLRNIESLTDEEIQVRIGARDAASAQLDQVRQELRQLDGSTATVRVESPGLQGLLSQLDDLPGRFGSAGGSIAASLRTPAAAAAALTAGLVAAGNSAANTALLVSDIARLTGSTTEEASALFAVWRRGGGDANDLLDVLAQMAGVLADDAEIADRLGVNLADGANLAERFVQVVDSVGEATDDAAERAVLMSRVFGEEGARQVNALIGRVDELGAAIDDVPAGQLITDDDVSRAKDWNRELAAAEANVRGLGNTVGFASLEVLNVGLGALGAGFGGIATFGEELGRGSREFFDSTAQANRETAEAFARSEAAAAGFNRELIAAATSADQVRAAAVGAGLDLAAQNIVVADWAREWRAAGNDVDVAVRQASSGVDTFERRIVESYDRAAASERAVAGLDAIAAGVAAATEEVGRFQREIGGFRVDLDGDRLLLDLADGFARVQAAQAAAAEAANTPEAEQRARDLAREQLRLNELVLQYIESLGDVPAERFTSIRAAIGRGDLAEAERQLNDLSRDRTARLDLQISQAEAIAAAFSGILVQLGTRGATQTGPGAAPITNITIMNPPGTPAATATNAAQYVIRNGGRGGRI